MKDYTGLAAWGKMSMGEFLDNNPDYFTYSDLTDGKMTLTLPTIWVDGVTKQIDVALNKTGRAYLFEGHLYYPESTHQSDIPDDNDDFLNFIYHLQNVLNAGQNSELSGWIARRLHSTQTARKYYQFALFLDEKVQPGLITGMIEKIWRLYGKGYLSCPYFISIDNEVDGNKNDAILRTLYNYSYMHNCVKDDFDIVILPEEYC